MKKKVKYTKKELIEFEKIISKIKIWDMMEMYMV